MTASPLSYWMNFSIWVRQSLHFLPFQRIWEEITKEAVCYGHPLRLLISMMESQTPGLRQPFIRKANRADPLKQIPFAHYHEFFLAKPAENSLSYTLLAGGVPKYIELFSRAATSIVLSRNAY